MGGDGGERGEDAGDQGKRYLQHQGCPVMQVLLGGLYWLVQHATTPAQGCAHI